MPEDPTEAVPTNAQWTDIPAHRPLELGDPREIGGYRLRARLGEGGMGHVFLSRTPGGRPVAIKVIRREFADDPGFRRRFAQEVATAQRVQGLYTAPVIDADIHGARPWLATAYVAGPSLQETVGAFGPLPAETVLVLIAGVAEALQSIHAAGIVHRDLKPSNVILAADGPRVIDFGIARAVDTTSLTQTGMRVGTPAFMAPEQVSGQSAAPAVDIFALGAMAVFAAAGELPFGGGLDPLVPHRILEQEPNLDGCPQPVREVAERCLAKDPAQRPSPTELIELCRERTSGTQLEMGKDWLPPTVAAAVQRIAATPDPPLPALPAPPKKSRKAGWITAGAAVVVIAALVATALLTDLFNTTGGTPEAGPGATTSQRPTPTTAESSAPTTEPGFGDAERPTGEPAESDGSDPDGSGEGEVLPPEDDLPPFSPSNEPVYDSLREGLEIGNRFRLEWKSTGYLRIEVTDSGLVGQRGNQFSILASEQDDTFQTCSKQKDWVSTVNWDQVKRGDFVCIRYQVFLGVFRIDAMPDFSEIEPFFVYNGLTWERKVG